MTSLNRTPVATFNCLNGGGVSHEFSASRDGDRKTVTLDGKDREVNPSHLSALTPDFMAHSWYFPEHEHCIAAARTQIAEVLESIK